MLEDVPSLGLDRFPFVRTCDFDLGRRALSVAYRDLDARLSGDARRFEWRANMISVGPVQLAHGLCRGEVVVQGELEGYFISMARRGVATAMTQKDRVEIVAGRSAAVLSPGEVVCWEFRDELLTRTVSIDPRFVEAEIAALTGQTPRVAPRFAPHLDISGGAGATLDRICQLLIAELERGSDALSHPLVASTLCDALVRQLLFGQPHDLAHLFEKPAPPSSRSIVGLVEGYLEAHASKPIHAADLAALTGASACSVEATFRAHRGSTPAVFLCERRLDLARQRLLEPEPGATVPQVAHASGFLRVARFDAAYLARFGEKPQETRARGLLARAEPAPRRPARPAAAPARPVVFVLDADPDAQAEVAGILRRKGHEVSAFASPRAFLAAVGPAPDGCAVLDLRLPELDGLEVQAALRAAGSALPLVFVTGDADVETAVEAMKGGALDVLRRPFGDGALLAAVELALALGAEARRAREEREALATRLVALSPQQRAVCERVARGLLNKQIAAELQISERMVREHRARGMERLGVTSAAEMARVFERLEEEGSAG